MSVKDAYHHWFRTGEVPTKFKITKKAVKEALCIARNEQEKAKHYKESVQAFCWQEFAELLDKIQKGE